MTDAVGAVAAPAISLQSVGRRFDTGAVVLDQFDLTIPTGQFIAVLGPSGCGKSTLLRLIAGLDRPQAGTVNVDAAGSGGLSHIAYVFQDAHLLPWRTILANVALPLELLGRPKVERLDAAREALELVGLADAARLHPNQLSGGMRMRASLARAMVARPRVLLLDEPFAALDEITRQRLDEQLRELWMRTRMTVVFVTHSTAEAIFLAERAVVLSKRPAKIVLDNAIDLPMERRGPLRATPEFAEQTRAVFEALEHGEASS